MKRKIIGLICLCSLISAVPTSASSIDMDKIEQEANERSEN